MAGLYPDQTLIQRNAIPIREKIPNIVTMSQHFRKNGYFATRIGKIYHYNVPRNIGTGGHDDPDSWDHTINPYGRDKWDEDKVFSLRPGSYGGTLSWLSADGEDREQTDGMTADAAIRLLKRHAADEGGAKKPFYLAVGLFRPHTPYVAPHKYFEMYDVDSIAVPPKPTAEQLESLPEPAVKSIRRKREQWDLDPKLAKQAIQAYYASITFADAQVGRILDALKQTGLEKNTIVLFTSDHGYHMGEHGHYQKTTLFENAAHVPLIIAGPGVKAAGQSAAGPVEMTDFYPTLTELAGLKQPRHLAGKSLALMLANPEQAVREAALTQYENGYSIRTAQHRYTEWGERGSLGVELYDHAADPKEMNNLAGQPAVANVTKKLAALLHRRVAEATKKPAGVTQRRAK